MLAFQHINWNYRVSVWASETGTSHQLMQSWKRFTGLFLEKCLFQIARVVRGWFWASHKASTPKLTISVICWITKNGAFLRRKKERMKNVKEMLILLSILNNHYRPNFNIFDKFGAAWIHNPTMQTKFRFALVTDSQVWERKPHLILWNLMSEWKATHLKT